MANFLDALLEQIYRGVSEEGPKRIQYLQQAVQYKNEKASQIAKTNNQLQQILPKAYDIAQKEADKTGKAQPLDKYIRMFGYPGDLPEEFYEIIQPKTQQVQVEVPKATALPTAGEKGAPSVRSIANDIYKFYQTQNPTAKQLKVAEALKLYEQEHGKLNPADRKRVLKDLVKIKETGQPIELPEVQIPEQPAIYKPVTVEPSPKGGGLMLDDTQASLLARQYPHVVSAMLGLQEPITSADLMSNPELEKKAMAAMQDLGFKFKDMNQFLGKLSAQETKAAQNYYKYAPLKLSDNDVKSIIQELRYYANSLLPTSDLSREPDVVSMLDDPDKYNIIKSALLQSASRYSKADYDTFKNYLSRLNQIYLRAYNDLRNARRNRADKSADEMQRAMRAAESMIKASFNISGKLETGQFGLIEMVNKTLGGEKTDEKKLAIIKSAYDNYVNSILSVWRNPHTTSSTYRDTYVSYASSFFNNFLYSFNKSGVAGRAYRPPTATWITFMNSKEVQSLINIPKDATAKQKSMYRKRLTYLRLEKAKKIMANLRKYHNIYIADNEVNNFVKLLDTMYGIKF